MAHEGILRPVATFFRELSSVTQEPPASHGSQSEELILCLILP